MSSLEELLCDIDDFCQRFEHIKSLPTWLPVARPPSIGSLAKPPHAPRVSLQVNGGFKLHLVVNDRGELLNIILTPGNTDAHRPVLNLLQKLFGKVFADRGYISQKLATQLLHTCGIELVTKLRRNMKNRLMRWADQLLLRKRAIIESIIDQLKNISQIEHSRHRSSINFLVNLVGRLIDYCHQPKKPSLKIDPAMPHAA
jgi:transposase